MRQVRAVTLTGFLEVASFVGLDGLQLLRENGIAPAMLADPEHRLKASQAINLIQRAAEESGCDSFGLLMVSTRTFASLGPITLLLQHLGTAGQVARAMRDYSRHINDILMIDVEQGQETSIIRVDLSDAANRHAIDIAVGATYLALAGASGGHWTPERVHFVHDKPANLAAWKQLFRAPLEFRSEFNGFSCSSASFGARCPLANEELAEHAKRLLNLVTLPRVDEPVSVRVRRTIQLLLPEGRTSLQQVAKNIAMTGRTLQRHLDAEGKTFGQLITEVRRETVQQYLSDSSQNISAIAELSGYNSVASFSRWFSAEFGMTPRAWRAARLRKGEGPPPIWRI